MKKHTSSLLFLISLIFIFSCKKTQKPEEIPADIAMDYMPNPKTQYDTIYTYASADSISLIKKLSSHLAKAGFRIKERNTTHKDTYYNCEENRIYLVQGNGVREYFIRRIIPEKGTADTYPDFVVREYSFPTEEQAQQNFKILDKALNSAGGYCMDKSPQKVVINGNKIFHLATRAEMFRGYIEKYGDILKDYNK
ncbi:hypothetical protein [Chryseobacterium sp.]|uniref:hypothetical protein n=1 Tax=Chryseobacterium sp. TaxID=1871047 RepID=UPI0025C5D703|nr:hypothetical protein [Chryseobacterium sp.]